MALKRKTIAIVFLQTSVLLSAYDYCFSCLAILPFVQRDSHFTPLKQKLEQELADHQNLLLSVSKAAAKLVQKPGDATDEDELLTPESLYAKWKTLSRQLSERKTQLQDIIEQSEPGVSIIFISIFMYVKAVILTWNTMMLCLFSSMLFRHVF